MEQYRNNAQESGEDTDGNTIIHSFIEENRGDTDTLKRHIKFVKWIGVLLLLFCSTSIPGILILNKENAHQSTVLDYKIEADQNETACVFIKQYDIYHGTYVTVCNRYGVVVLDIRRFVNDTPSIIGIQLTERQWIRLKQVWPLVDKSILEARMYWRDLKVLKYGN